MEPQDQTEASAKRKYTKRAQPEATAPAAVTDSEITEALARHGIEPLDLQDDIARIRAMRESQPFGAFDQKLALAPIEGYKPHWFNDKPGRIDMALRAGWTHVLDKDGKPKSLIVDSGGLRGYAMKIPQQFWDEDQARQQAKATAALNAVKKKPAPLTGKDQAKDQGAFYTPNASGDAATITRS